MSTTSKNDDPAECPSRVMGGCEMACVYCGRGDEPEGPHAGFDAGVREELVDVLDTHMRLDDRGDAERVADALIGAPALLRALASFSQPPVHARPHRAYWTSPDTWCDPDCIECGGEGAPCCDPPDHPPPAVPDGEDVPARLAAAADAWEALDSYSCAPGDLRRVATSLRLHSPEVRAAVAAALTRTPVEEVNDRAR